MSPSTSKATAKKITNVTLALRTSGGWHDSPGSAAEPRGASRDFTLPSRRVVRAADAGADAGGVAAGAAGAVAAIAALGVVAGVAELEALVGEARAHVAGGAAVDARVA